MGAALMNALINMWEFFSQCHGAAIMHSSTSQLAIGASLFNKREFPLPTVQYKQPGWHSNALGPSASTSKDNGHVCVCVCVTEREREQEMYVLWIWIK